MTKKSKSISLFGIVILFLFSLIFGVVLFVLSLATQDYFINKTYCMLFITTLIVTPLLYYILICVCKKKNSLYPILVLVIILIISSIELYNSISNPSSSVELRSPNNINTIILEKSTSTANRIIVKKKVWFIFCSPLAKPIVPKDFSFYSNMEILWQSDSSFQLNMKYTQNQEVKFEADLEKQEFCEIY